MALGTKQVGAAAASSVAAATVRVGTGGRNVANTSRADVERIDYAHQPNLNEEAILRYQQEGQVSPDGRRQRDNRGGSDAPLWRNEFPRTLPPATSSDDSPASEPFRRLFLDEVLRGIGLYEQSIRITSPAATRPGSVVNFLY